MNEGRRQCILNINKPVFSNTILHFLMQQHTRPYIIFPWDRLTFTVEVVVAVRARNVVKPCWNLYRPRKSKQFFFHNESKKYILVLLFERIFIELCTKFIFFIRDTTHGRLRKLKKNEFSLYRPPPQKWCLPILALMGVVARDYGMYGYMDVRKLL